MDHNIPPVDAEHLDGQSLYFDDGRKGKGDCGDHG
jgi:hypothetical protein